MFLLLFGGFCFALLVPKKKHTQKFASDIERFFVATILYLMFYPKHVNKLTATTA